MLRRPMILVLLMAIALSGCAKLLVVPLSPTHAPLKRITLLLIHEPNMFQIWTNSYNDTIFTPAINSALTKDYVAYLNANHISLGQALTNEIKSELERNGVSVEISTAWPIYNPDMPGEEKDDYSKIQTTADAILSVWFGTTGWYDSNGYANYAPVMIVSAQLIDPRNQEKLYRQTYQIGFPDLIPVDGMEYITFMDKGTIFTDSDLSVKENEASVLRSIEVLKSGHKKFAAAIAMKIVPNYRASAEVPPPEVVATPQASTSAPMSPPPAPPAAPLGTTP